MPRGGKPRHPQVRRHWLTNSPEQSQAPDGVGENQGVHPTDLLDGHAAGSCPDGFFYKEKPPYTLFEPVLAGGLDEMGHIGDPSVMNTPESASRSPRIFAMEP
jgi:hypothetical protein